MTILEDLKRKFDPILLKVNQGNTYVPIEDFLDATEQYSRCSMVFQGY